MQSTPVKLDYAPRSGKSARSRRRWAVILSIAIAVAVGLYQYGPTVGEEYREYLDRRQQRLNHDLFVAVWMGDVEGVRWLLQKGAQVNAGLPAAPEAVLKDDPELNWHEWTPLWLLAVSENRRNAAAVAQLLIDAGAHVNVKDWSGTTPLHDAAYTATKTLRSF